MGALARPLRNSTAVTPTPGPAPQGGGEESFTIVEEVIDALRQFLVDAFHRFQLSQRRT